MNLDAKAVVHEMKRPCLVVDAWANVRGYEEIREDLRVSVFRIGVGQ